MSFSEDPYKHVAVTFRDGTFGWECNSCGADSRYRVSLDVFFPSAPVEDIARAFWNHVKMSHKMLPEDTKDWS